MTSTLFMEAASNFALLQTKGRSLTVCQLIDMLCGVASGMQHIVSKGFVHTVKARHVSRVQQTHSIQCKRVINKTGVSV